MLYRSVGKMGRGALFITIPVDIVMEHGIKKGDVLRLVKTLNGFRVVVEKTVDVPAVEFDS